MPKVTANGITMNYEQQGSGEPLVLIPYLSADHACYAFQVAEYAKHFTCISLDLRDTGETQNSETEYSTANLADDVAAFLGKIGVGTAHISGLSFGGAVGMWLAAKYPECVLSLSIHGGWHKTDAYAKAVVEGWQVMAKALDNVQELLIRGIFPWCFTPDLYAAKPEYIQSLADFVRSRPAQTIAGFMRQSNAVLSHDASAQLSKIAAPTLITFGKMDQVTSTRFAAPLRAGIRNSEFILFEKSSHAPIYEEVEEFNKRTLAFLLKNSRVNAGVAAS